MLTVSDVEVRKDQGDLEGLIEALNTPDQNVRWAAVRALGEIGRVEAAAPLRGAMNDENPFVRRAAVQALGMLGANGGEDVSAALVDALADGDPYVRREAIEALERIGPVGGWDPFVYALQDEFRDVRMAGLRALGTCGEPWTIDLLVGALGDVDPHVRKTATKTLVALGGSTVEALIVALGHEEWIVRQYAAWALSEIRPVQALDALIAALTDREAVVREVAARALGAIGDPRADAALAEVAERDQARDVRRSANDARRLLN